MFKNIILDNNNNINNNNNNNNNINNNNNNNDYDNVRRSIIDISSNKLLSINFDEILNHHNIQINLINMLYHNDKTLIEKKIIINELKKKNK